jgi:hypothetical protein
MCGGGLANINDFSNPLGRVPSPRCSVEEITQNCKDISSNHTTGNNKKVILASLVPTHPGSASPFRTVIRLLLRAMGIRCSVSRLTRSPNGLTTLDTSLPAQCAMATPSLDRAIPRQGGIRPLTYVRQVQPALEPAQVTERRYSFPLL